MKVFISWSGERSKALATALKEWLPMAIQHVEPWMSDKDVRAGERWAESVSTQLKDSNVGIVCVTNENLTSEWLHFEAGALSKSMQDGAVITALLDGNIQEVAGPLTQFQMKKVDEQGILDIAEAINTSSGNKLEKTQLSGVVKGLWDTLQKKLDGIPKTDATRIPKRSESEILEDLVTSVRGLRRQIENPNDERDVSERHIHSRLHRSSHPMLIRKMVRGSNGQETETCSYGIADTRRNRAARYALDFRGLN